MNIVEKIELINSKQKDLDKEKLELKSEFEKYIKDKSISVCQRWHVFAQADDSFKNHSRWLPNPRGPMLSKKIEAMTDVPECYGRGKRIDILDLFYESYSVEDKMFYPQAEDDDCELEPATDYSAEEIVDLDMFDLMEEILQKNLGSFCFDW